MTLSKPILGLFVGGTLGVLDGLSGFLYPNLAPLMTTVISVSVIKGLVSGVVIGLVAQRLHSMLLGILVGASIAAALSLLIVLHAGVALLWDILLPGLLLGIVVGFATQRFGRSKPASSQKP